MPKAANGFEFSLLTDSTEISSYLNDVYAGDDLSGDRDQCGQPHQMATSCPSTVLSPSVHSVHVILSIAISYPEKCTLPFWKPQPTRSKLVCLLSKGLRKEVSSKCSKSQEHWVHHHLPRLMRIGTERSSPGFYLYLYLYKYLYLYLADEDRDRAILDRFSFNRQLWRKIKVKDISGFHKIWNLSSYIIIAGRLGLLRIR